MVEGTKRTKISREVGVSIYESKELKSIDMRQIDIVQLPLSLYDQRLIKDGTIRELREKNIAIHARSIYLQGLILTSHKKWPKWINEEARSHQEGLEIYTSRKKCSLLEMAIGFAKQQKELEAVVIGICGSDELRDLLHAWEYPPKYAKKEWSKWEMKDTSVLDPRKWPKR